MVEHGPPRFLLSIDQQGGAGKWPFIGPPLAVARGMLGGAGERDVRWFDHLAVSPDGQAYLRVRRANPQARPRRLSHQVPGTRNCPKPWLGEAADQRQGRHALQRPARHRHGQGRPALHRRPRQQSRAWSSPPTASGSANSPWPIRCRFSSIRSGDIYVSSIKTDNLEQVHRLDHPEVLSLPPDCGQPKQVAEMDAGKECRRDGPGRDGQQPELWVAMAMAAGQDLVPVTDTRRASWRPARAWAGMTGLRVPMFISADVPHGKVYVAEVNNAQRQIDIASGQMKIFPQRRRGGGRPRRLRPHGRGLQPGIRGPL